MKKAIVIGLWACFTMTLSPGPGAWAQQPAGPVGDTTAPIASEADAATVYSQAAVTLDGNELFHVRGIKAFPAEQRAAGIRARIEAIAADRSVAVESLRVVAGADRTDISAADRFVMALVDADVLAEGVSRQIMAEIIRTRIANAIVSYRHDRSAHVLLTNSLYALGATLVFVILLIGFRRAFRRLTAIIERRLKARLEGLEVQAHRLIQAKQVWGALRGMVQGLHVLTVLIATYLYLDLVLSLYPWTRPVAVRLLAIFLDPLRAMGMGLLYSLPNLVFLGMLILVTVYLLKIIGLFFTGIDRGTIRLQNFDSDLALPTYKIVRAVLIVFMVVVAYPHIPGSESTAFKGVSIFLGVIMSLGASSIIANLFAGYSVIYRRAFKVGDRIRIDDITGVVTRIGLIVTHLRTLKNEAVTVPNSHITNSNVINYSALARPDGLILHTTVGIGYETPWRQVEAMLLIAADRTPGLLKEPAPFVLQKSLDDFAVTYEINVYCDDPHRMGRFYTALHQNILDIFNEHGVQIMTPAYEGDPEIPKVVPREEWQRTPAGQTRAQPADPRQT